MLRTATLVLLCWIVTGPTTAQDAPLLNTFGSGTPVPLLRIGWGIPYDLAYMPDGATLVTTTSAGITLYRDRVVQLSIDTGDHAPSVVAISPDGTRIATGSDEVRVWDSTTGELVYRFESGLFVRGLAFSPDGTRLVASRGMMSRGAGIVIYDLQNGRQLPLLQNQQGYFHDARFLPDGDRLLAQQVYDCCGNLSLLDMDSDTQIRIMDEASAFVLTNNPNRVIGYRRGAGLALYDLTQLDATSFDQAPLLRAEFDGGYRPILSEVSVNDEFYSISEDGTLTRWDADTLMPLQTIPLEFVPDNAAFNADGTRYAAFGPEGNTLYMGTTGSGEVEDLYQFHQVEPGAIAFTGDDLLAYVANNRVYAVDWRDTSHLYPNVYTWEDAHRATINTLVGTESGAIYSGSDDGTIRLWQQGVKTSTILYQHEGGRIWKLALGQENDLYAMVCFSGGAGELIALNMETRERLGFYPDADATEATLMALPVPCSDSLAIDYSNRMYYADWNWAYILQDRRLSESNRTQLPVAGAEFVFDSWGEYLIYINAGAALIDNSPHWRVVVSHRHKITALAALGVGFVSSACKIVGYAWADTYCYGADMVTTDHNGYVEPLIGHSGIVTDIVFHRTEPVFASVSEDGTLIVWASLVEPQATRYVSGGWPIG